MGAQPPLTDGEFFREYAKLLFIIQELYKEYNSPGMRKGDHDFALVQWEREIFTGGWKFVQAKHLFPILQVIAASNGINFNSIKNAIKDVNAQTLTNRLNQLQELNLIERQVTVYSPLSVRYSLTPFGTNFGLLAFPFFILFRMKSMWEKTCQAFQRHPPNLPLSNGDMYPDIQARFEAFQEVDREGKENLEQRRNILHSPFRSKAIQVIFTALQMSQEMASRLTENAMDPAQKAQSLANVKQAMEAVQGKFFFDITYVLYACETLSFNDLKKLLPDINSPTLSTRLKELEQIDVVTRTEHDSSPRKVIYNLTTFGQGLLCIFWPIIALLGLYSSDL